LERLLNRKFSINFSIRLRSLIVLGVSVLLATYITWTVYWFLDQGLFAIRWHTHIVFTGLVFAVPVLLLGILNCISSNGITQRLLNVSVIIAVTAISLETALVVTGISKNYMERRAGVYQSPYDQNMGNYYNIRQPNDTVRLESGEFSFSRNTNSLGHSDREWNVEKDSSKVRIITLGDSFTEGDGASADSTYPVQLEAMLNGAGLHVEVMNAGTSGSDPFFCYRNLQDRLLTYSPDIVIQTVSSDDILYDIPLRGGMERFGPNGELQLAAPPWWEPVVAASYVFRELFRLFGYDIDRPYGAEKNPGHVRKMGELLDGVIRRQDSLGREHGFTSLWFVLPMKHEAHDGKHVFPFEEWATLPRMLETSNITMLLPCYGHTMKSEGTPPAHYYWRIDGHHNRFGYGMMARCIADQVLPLHNNDMTSMSATP